MKTRKGLAGGRRKKGVSDVSPSTSLPPLVEGQLRCFLRLTVSKILWTISKPPSPAIVRVRWWGETSDGTLFRPRDTIQIEQKAVKTTTRYAIRCGPKQFNAYLTDMDVLVLEVMTKLDHLPVGRVQIHGLTQLSPAHPIGGFFTILSPTSEKLGELKVSLTLEPLSDTCDSSSSLLTTDISLDAAVSALQGRDEFSKPRPVVSSEPQRLAGAVTGKESISSSRATTPRGKDHLYFQEKSETTKDYFVGPVSQSEVLKYQEQGHPKEQITFSHSSETQPQSKSATDNPATKDLLSALLDQGNKLRNAMIVSSMKASLETTVGELNPSLKKDIHKTAKHQLTLPSSKGPFQNLLDDSVVSPTKNPFHFSVEDPGQDLDALSESRTIQLLLGSDPFPLHYWGERGSPPDSLSIGSDICDNSELNDPHYDQSLLENLFYSAPKSDSSLSDFFSDDDEVQVNRETVKKRILRNGSDNICISQKVSESHVHDPKEMEEEKNISSRRQSSDGTLEPTEMAQVVNLTVDRLALLGRINVARVIIESLKIPPDSIQTTQAKQINKGKPPRPTSSVKRTFFVEYGFPVASSKNAAGQVSLATEITRVASSKISDGVVKFQQRFVFPVRFSGMMIEHWWNADLVFRIFWRKGTQKKPMPIGTAVLSLHDVIQSELLSLRCDLQVHQVEEENEKPQIGPLKVALELSGDNKDFTSVNMRTSCTGQQPTSYVVSSPRVKVLEPERDLAHTEWSPHVKIISHDSPRKSNETHQKATDVPCASILQQPQLVQLPEFNSLMKHVCASAEEKDGMLLHLILMVPDGKDFVAWENEMCSPYNLYLNCKLFSTHEATRSPVTWSTTQPSFNFSQVAPVSLTRTLLERMKNNVMVIEVWNKVMSPGKDRLLGLVKLPLHQLYMSFSDPKISRLLLQAQYPVVAVDSYMPVVDVFTGDRNGSLRVLLAMGSSDQVMALQRLKNDEGTLPSIIQRPAHFLDLPSTSLPMVETNMDGLTEHIFEIHVENIKGLTPLQATVWGEADCYVQYCFPVQPTNSGVLKEIQLLEHGVILKPIRSVTTLCTPDPVFNSKQSHSLLMPVDVPVQRMLLSAFSKQGMTSGGGVHFEVWCRYYYPNVRDQMIAKGILPLSRLCAIVTMQHHEEVGIQTFNLPLISRTDSTEEHHLQSSGLITVSVKYRRTSKTVEGVLAARVISISVQLHRASGLQAAARAVAEHDPSFQYIADVGVNAYVSVHLSFFPNDQKRHTRAVARTFTPEFDHHTEFSCNLVIQRSSGEVRSLAELLQFAEVLFFIHHQSIQTGSGVTGTPSSQDHLLGIVRVPTKDLLTRRSGIAGWYPVTLPQELIPFHKESMMQTVVGGLELSIVFAHHMDRERVMEAARTLGWNEVESHDDTADNIDEWQQKGDPMVCMVSIPRVWLPVHCLLFAGQECIHKSTYCYLRYKLYSSEAVWSALKKPRLTEDEKQGTVKFDLVNSVALTRHPQLLWYLREERLEIQVWRAYGKGTNEERPLNTDRLIGCAYVDLAALGERSPRTLTISGVYPLFKRNALDLSGAGVRVHIALSPAYPHAPSTRKLDYIEDVSCTEDEEKEISPGLNDKEKPDSEAQSTPNPTSYTPMQSTASQEAPIDLENTFAASVTVERAMHLSLKGSPLTERTIATPSCCVSFAVAGSKTPIMSSVIENTDSPVWNFQQQTRLSKELLLDSQQTLVFKVWHKTDIERVIGFASVDLSPLLSGFQTVCGWYNISDFSGQCQGQIKVSITPLEAVYHLKEEKQARSQSKESIASVHTHSPFLFPDGSVPAYFSNYIPQPSELLMKNGTPQDTSIRNFDSRCVSSGVWTSRHEEHMQNIRRFHESLQQVERNTHSVEVLDVLPQSSRSSLLIALRKNLNDLDEIQRYFNQKLKRSFCHLEPDRSSQKNQEIPGGQLESVTAVLDTNAQNLLEKSKQLVSQVGNLIDDLQNISKDSKASFTMPSNNIENKLCEEPAFTEYQRDARPVIQDRVVDTKRTNMSTPLLSILGSQRRDTVDTFEEQAIIGNEAYLLIEENQSKEASNNSVRSCRSSSIPNQHDIAVRQMMNQTECILETECAYKDTPAFPSLESSSCRKGMLDEFINQAVPRQEDHLLLGENPIEEPENVIQSCSEEDYDEAIIEPRTLNEVTTMTDKTSPWSSIVSEPDQEPREQSLNVGSMKPQLGTTEQFIRNHISSLLQHDHENMNSAAKASNFQSIEDTVASLWRKDEGGSDGDVETDDSEPLQLSQSRSHHVRERSLDSINSILNNESSKHEEAEEPGTECESQMLPSRPIDLLGGGDCDISQGSTIIALTKSGPLDSDSEQHVDVSNKDLHSDRKSSRCNGNSDGECLEHVSITPNETAKSGITQSDPLLVPNFFLPPEHLEASMRMLRYSHFPSSTASKKESDATCADSTTGSIPFQKQKRLKTNLLPAELPKEEMDRIARIFTARFSSKE